MARLTFFMAFLALLVSVGGVWSMNHRAAAAAYTERIAAQPGEQFQYQGGDIVVQPGQRIRFDNGTGCGPTLYQERANLVLQNTCTGEVSSLYVEPAPNPPLNGAQRTRIVLGTTTDRTCTSEYELFTAGPSRMVEAVWTYNRREGCQYTGEELSFHRIFGPTTGQMFPYETMGWDSNEWVPLSLRKIVQAYEVDRPLAVPFLRFVNRHPSPDAGAALQLILQGPDGDIVVNTPLQVVKAGQGTRTEMWAVGPDGQERIGLTVP